MKYLVLPVLAGAIFGVSSADTTYKSHLPEGARTEADRQISTINAWLHLEDLSLELPRTESDEEFARYMLEGLREKLRLRGDDPERIIGEAPGKKWNIFTDRGTQKPLIVKEPLAVLDPPILGVEEVQVFIISRGYNWKLGEDALVEYGQPGEARVDMPVGEFIREVLLPVPRIAAMLRSQDALVAVGMASAGVGQRGVEEEERRSKRRSQELAKALAHCKEVESPVFCSDWGRYLGEDGRDRPWQREIVILGLKGKGLEAAKSLPGLMAGFSKVEKGGQGAVKEQFLEPADYSAKQENKDPWRYVDADAKPR